MKPTNILVVGSAPASAFHVTGEPFATVLEASVDGETVACPRRYGMTLRDCEDCRWSLGTGDGGARQRCLSTGDASVSSWMTPGPSLATVDAASSCEAAACVLAASGRHHLLVLDGERRLAGVVCACDLARRPKAAVRHCLAGDVYVTGPATPLAEAAAAMRALGISTLPVVDGPLVVGIFTRHDLRRAGVPGDWHCACSFEPGGSS